MENKKRRLLAVDKGSRVGVRLQPGDIKALDRWIRQNGKNQTRSEAVRHLVNFSLVISDKTSGLAKNGSPHAIELAGIRIGLLLKSRMTEFEN